ncbi:MAG: ribosomal-protein-alanine N-acetyltransferase [Crocinitomix sp.]|jgi:ribosomal-protein-alanine N-acetyltransferase
MSTIIETDRIILRRFNLTDFEAVYEFNSDTEVIKYTGDPMLKSLDEAKELIKNVWLSDYEKCGYGRWATIYKPDNKIIGFAGLKYLPEMAETDLGFRFLPQYWNKGIATEISPEILEYGFNKLNLKRIIAIAEQENIGSNKVLEKIGMQHYKIADYEGDGIPYNWYKVEVKS